MKLLKLKIENKDGFRSLQQGFEINFHTLADTEAMEKFRPFCFAGLNGSGKSNVLEALANIFYHLEVCVARYLPDSIRNVEIMVIIFSVSLTITIGTKTSMCVNQMFITLR